MTESEKERFEILQEHMDRNFDVIAEGYSVLSKNLERFREESREGRVEITNQLTLVAKNLSNQIAGNREEIGKNRKEIGKNRKEIGKNREKIEEVGRKVDENHRQIKEHDCKMDRFIKKTEEHDERIDRLEFV